MRSVSIIICTSNRLSCLARTMESLATVQVPEGISCELIVVNNGPPPHTAMIASMTEGLQFLRPIQVLHQPERGKSRALNLALKHARGDVLLFTDDDVRPPSDWIQQMIEPITLGEAEAVAGGVRLAGHLRREWMGTTQRSWLASTEHLPPLSSHPLIGANMAVSRKVLQHVPAFDPHVGPGAKGHAEDTLFWLQLRESGMRIVSRLWVQVEHWPTEDRLSRGAFMKLAEKHGEMAAYVEHHWEWFSRRMPLLAFLAAAARLWIWRLRNPAKWLWQDGITAQELMLLEKYHSRRCLLLERTQPRKYSPRGLCTLDTCTSS